MGTLRAISPLVIGICVFYALHAIPVPGEEKYSSKWDNIDYKSILNSKRVLNSYVKCFLDEGPCTSDSKILKDELPTILANQCKRCTDKQKINSLDALEIVQKEHPHEWELLRKRWDPDDKLTQPLMELLRKETRKA